MGIATATISGCGPMRAEKATTRPAGTVDDLDELTKAQSTPAWEGTIRSVTTVQGANLLRVRGYGLVTNLGGQGSRNAPPSVREYLMNEIRRQRAASLGTEENVLTPDQILDSLDTAVVVVEGQVPPGATSQRTFDVFVQAMDPDTQSIAGGYLQLCELKIYREVGPAEALEGRTHAKARGPIFINPFAATGGGTTVNPREGIVIGGGANTLERKLSLVNVVESYSSVRQLRDLINRRLPQDPPVADAVSPTNVDLTVPPLYREREGRLLEHILYLPLNTSNVYLEARAKSLAAELARPEVSLPEISLAIEGVGLSAVPMVQPLYTHPRPPVNFYAARAGLRLGDPLAIEVVIRHAQDADSPFRRQAIHELGECGLPPAATKGRALVGRAGAVLRGLLGDGDPQIRIRAYEALRRVDPSSILRVVVGSEPENFLLEMVPCGGEPMIYVKRTEIRRIALLGGERMVCQPPLLYAEPGRPVTLSAADGDQVLTVLRKDRQGGIMVGPLKAPLDVPSLIRLFGQKLARDFDGKVAGLGLDYSVILDLLYRLSENKAINAQVRWEEGSIEDILGPVAPMGRPESEL